MDAALIAAKLDAVRGSLHNISNIKRQVTTIQTAADKIRKSLGETTDAVNTALDDVSDSLKTSGE